MVQEPGGGEFPGCLRHHHQLPLDLPHDLRKTNFSTSSDRDSRYPVLVGRITPFRDRHQPVLE